MTTSLHPELDLTVSRIIKAPRSAVWSAWADPASFEQWWVPAPEVCRVRDMDLRPGGSFRTEISQDGTEYTATAIHRTAPTATSTSSSASMTVGAPSPNSSPSSSSHGPRRDVEAEAPERTRGRS
jgi:hypothetical protein